jgi:hypothetical protein
MAALCPITLALSELLLGIQAEPAAAEAAMAVEVVGKYAQSSQIAYDQDQQEPLWKVMA